MKKISSFSKSFFFGNLLEDIVSPYPHFSKDEKENVDLLFESLAKFGKEHINSTQIDREAKIPEKVLTGMKELGLFGLIIPQEYGGFGFSQTAYCKTVENFVQIDNSCAITIGAHQSIGLKALLLFGTPEQKQKYLPKLATGEMIAAFSLTESGAGSDAAGIQTKAEFSEDKKYYILNGSKIWTTNGGIASFFTIFAKTMCADGVERVSAFIVTRDMPGFSTGKEEGKLGIKGSSTTSVTLTNCKVPAENVLNQVGYGFKTAMEVLNSGRLGLSSGCLGVQKKLIQLCVQYAQERKQFGKSISQFGLIQKKIAQMMREAYATESLVYMTTGLVDRGNIDYSLESAICKVFASESLWRTVNEALQICAGNGYMKDYPYEQLLRDCRINMIFEGTNEILRMFIALSGIQGPGERLKEIGRALKDPIKSVGLLSGFAVKKIRKSLAIDRFKSIDPGFKDITSFLEEYIMDFSSRVETALARHGKSIIDKQFALERLSQMAMELYMLTCVIMRATDAIKREGKDKSKAHILISKAIGYRCLDHIRALLKQSDSNDDESIKQIAAYAYAQKGYDLDAV
ncbi:MAG: acyl-CoA dehydrogenase family protein [Deltaproteobacteria bacterium]|nr:acyl-CoA dehydrogenase family protein [Deltaproteobacteria bacterium]